MPSIHAVGRQSFLVVFDFDHTIVDCNTDEVIPKHLGRGDLHKALMKASDRLQWTKLMDTLCAPFTESQLREAAHASVTIDPGMPAVFDYLHAQQQKYMTREETATTKTTTTARTLESTAAAVPPFVEIDIASDSNLLFIEASLDARLPAVLNMVTQIHSNPYTNFDAATTTTTTTSTNKKNRCQEDEAARDAAHNANTARRSRIGWYEPEGHDCPCCSGSKPNMCKSIIIERLLLTTTLIDPTIIFIGDGANDYCPILNVLRPRDFMFCRRLFPLHKILSEPGAVVGGCCNIGLWSDAGELRQLFEAAFEHPQVRLPTLVRFRDAGAGEFRSVTMNHRIPAVLHRTLQENLKSKTPSGHPLVSEEGARLVRLLIDSAQNNGPVPPLPGQSVVPAWLRNYAYVSEYDTLTASGDALLPASERASHVGDGANPFIGVAPRWGQIPWIHGEIYFYHLLWQFLMLTNAGGEAAQHAVVAGGAAQVQNAQDTHAVDEAGLCEMNVITPHYPANPLFSQDPTVLIPADHCDAVRPLFSTPGHLAEPVVPMQSLEAAMPAGLITAPLSVAEGVIVSVPRGNASADGARTHIPYAALLPSYTKNGLLPARDIAYSPYRDIFLQEKTDVLVNFINVRVAPMLACEPWAAGDDFIGVLLRWALWGNGLDLSMFTIEQLSAAHGGGGAAKKADDSHGNDVSAKLRSVRAEEHEAAYKQDPNLVGNESAEVQAYLKAHVQRARANTDPAFLNHLDIVTDNVGVEVLSDICLALWFLEHAKNDAAPPTVGFHVKPMPYYVSDVTPGDFAYTLYLLEQAYTESESNTRSAAERETLRAILEPFVLRVRDAFHRGAFSVEADTVWTQPNEFRDMPPRVVNRYFFTQHLHPAATQKENLSSSLPSAADLYVANKDVISPKSILVIFKGDLNYRRLVGDRYWNRCDFMTTLVTDDQTRDLATAPAHYTPLQKKLVDELVQDTPESFAVEGPSFGTLVSAFWPSHVVPVCAIRTIKSECCVGVPADTKERLDQTEANGYKAWRMSGKYGLILFAH